VGSALFAADLKGLIAMRWAQLNLSEDDVRKWITLDHSSTYPRDAVSFCWR
jgi:hypothetical protein